MSVMKTVTAKEAHKKLGYVLDEAQHEPVRISKNGRPYSVVISAKLFETLQGIEALQADAKWNELFSDERSENALSELIAETKADIKAGNTLDYDPSNRP